MFFLLLFYFIFSLAFNTYLVYTIRLFLEKKEELETHVTDEKKPKKKKITPQVCMILVLRVAGKTLNMVQIVM